ncbi:TonB-dependent receptor [Capnocytophaga sp.]|uniref:SusC/RagA family TonB-linked outer membrane protein n=1 Tax=Capnocytophaga sp. TaxID=44737 RepID=UPI0026DAE956|nr:TonB-dependent receptor [Capnocytophaga sp.]MDO5105659.1 TonB-dependent receptor [Capnocytophaga sp.]
MRIKILLQFIFVFLGMSPMVAQTLSVKGVVTDGGGVPLPGASVVIKGTSKGVATDFDGNYEIQAKNGDVLEFSSIGFTSQTKKIVTTGGGKTLIINTSLIEEASQIEEVVVTGYGGIQKKASIVGSIQTISPSDLKVPSANLSTGFAGRMAGVIAFQRGGQPGADGANFYIRGIATMSGVTSPLIIVDGVQVSASDLNALAPEVIDSFTILKDATATAIYGSRGANGVMIVTTKSGANLDKPIINFRVEGTMSQPTTLPKMADGPTYMRLYNEAANNLSSGAFRYTQDQIRGTEQNLNPYVYPNVNWYDEIFKNRSFGQRVNFNIRGGGKKLDYFMSINATHDDGMVKGLSKEYFSFDNNISLKKYTFQNNINARLTESSKISLRLNAQLHDYRGPITNSGNKGQISINELFGKVVELPSVDHPIKFPAKEGDEHVRWGTNSERYVKKNPIAELVSSYKDNFQNTVIANLEYDQKLDVLTQGLRFNALASFKNWSSSSVYRTAPYNMYLLNGFTLTPNGEYDLDLGLVGTNPENIVLTSSAGTSGDRKIYLQGMFDYARTFGGVHAINAMAVYNQEQYDLNNIHADSSFKILVNSLPKRKQTIAGRISYAYDNRYMIEVNAGYNGSENFAPGKRWGFFPSVAVGYNLSEEPFFAELKDIVQVFKIRNSWGLVGNDQISNNRFLYLSSIDLGSNDRKFRTGVEQDYELKGPKYNRFQNNDLTWEVGEKLNFGIDLRLWNSLDFHFDMFREHRRNIFEKRGTIAKYLGSDGTDVYANSGEVINQGVDLSVNYDKTIGKDFNLSLKGTFTYAHNRIVKTDLKFVDYPNLSKVGHSIGMPGITKNGIDYGVLISEGLFIDQAEVQNRAQQKISSNVAAGDLKYRDIPNKDGVVDGQIDDNDRVWTGYPTTPEIIYGLGINASYKGWDAGIFFQGAANTSLLMSNLHPFGTNNSRNIFQWIADSHWSPDNQNLNAAYPRLTKDDHANNTTASTFWVRDASFLKLKTVEVGYTYKNMRLFVTGSNLLTFSSFKLWDPEQGGGNGLKYPTQRVFTLGFQMTINNK